MRRTSPYPSLLTFDAPTPRVLHRAPGAHQHAAAGADDAERSGLRRSRPRRRRARILAEGGTRARASARPYGFRLCTGATTAAGGVDRLVAFYERERQRFAGDPDAAAALAAPATAEASDDPADRAAWTVVANVLLNLDETVTKE